LFVRRFCFWPLARIWRTLLFHLDHSPLYAPPSTNIVCPVI
jgi:hypothetical protein